MNILYIGYWSLAEPLTTSVIIPRLKTLSSMDEVNKIIFCSFERSTTNLNFDSVEKVEHISFKSEKKQNLFATKISEFIKWPRFLKYLIVEHKINFVIANSTLAGSAANAIWKTYKIPFVVDCFEPHAQSMLESEVWKKWDLRYWILSYFEWAQRQNAWKLQTVSYHFTEHLLSKGIGETRIITLPNTVNIAEFKFDEQVRQHKRNELGFPKHAVVGIYVGKFGGIYYQNEAFDLFAQAFQYFGEEFRMIILSIQNAEFIRSNMQSRGISLDHIHITSSPHHEVSQYLNASDFAFATIKPTPVRVYCCPVKNGEYWANGLPVLLEDGIGDDSEIIKAKGGGVILNRKNTVQSFRELANLMAEGRFTLANKICLIAEMYRREELMKIAYSRIMNDFKNKAFT